MDKKSYYRAFAALSLVIIIDTMGVGIVFPVLSPLVMDKVGGLLPAHTSLQYRDIIYGLILGSFSIFMLIGAPFLGDLSDKWGRKKALMVCLVITMLSFLVCALGVYWRNVSLLVLGRSLDGFSAGSASIAQAAITDISTQENKARNLGLITLAICIGFVFGPVIGGFFADSPFLGLGFASPFIIAAMLAGLNAICLYFVFNETFAPKRDKHLSLARGFTIFVEAFQHKGIRRLSLAFFLMQIAWSIYFQYISLYLAQRYHYTPGNIGAYMAYVGLVFSISLSVLLNLVLRYFSPRQTLQLGFAVLGMSLLVAAIFHQLTVQWILVIPLAVSVALAYTCSLTLFSNAVDADSQGWVMGISSAIGAVGWLVGAISSGTLGSLNLSIPFLAAAIFSIIGLLVLVTEKKLAD